MDNTAPKTNIDSSTSSELDKASWLTSLVLPPLAKQLEIWVTVANILLGWLSVTLEVFIRHSFGERYLSVLKLFFAYGLIAMFMFLPSAFGGINPLMALFYLGFIGLSIFHRVQIARRNKRGELWHSQSFGISWLMQLERFSDKPFYRYIARFLDDWTLYRFVEPALCFFVGFVIIGRFSGTVAAWFFFSSIALFTKNQLVYSQQRGRYLDMIDAQIETSNMSEALNGQPKQKTKGFTVVPVPGIFKKALAEAKANPARPERDDLREGVKLVMGDPTPIEPAIPAASQKEEPQPAQQASAPATRKRTPKPSKYAAVQSVMEPPTSITLITGPLSENGNGSGDPMRRN